MVAANLPSSPLCSSDLETINIIITHSIRDQDYQIKLKGIPKQKKKKFYALINLIVEIMII